MIEELRARFMGRFLKTASERISRARAHAGAGVASAKALASELHALAGEASVLEFKEVALVARLAEAAAYRWQTGEGSAEAECTRSLGELEQILSGLKTSGASA